MPDIAVHPDQTLAADPRVAALRDALRELLDGYAEMAQRLEAYGPPGDVEQVLLEPLQQAAETAAALLSEAGRLVA